jgi:hypothetical protein
VQAGAPTPEQSSAAADSAPGRRWLTSGTVWLAVIAVLSLAALGLRWRSAVTLDGTGPDSQVVVAVVLGVLVLIVAASIPLAVLATRSGQRMPRRRSARRDVIGIVVFILALYLASRFNRDDRPQPTPGNNTKRGDARRVTDAAGADWSWLSGLALVALILAVALVVALASARARAATDAATTKPEGRQPTEQSLAVAVQAARRALDLGDGDRAAVIASYTAMQRALEAQGVPLSASDTAADLLDRVTRLGLVTGPAASQLADLYRRARFSPHALPPDAVDSALRSLAAMQVELSAAGQLR